MFRLSRLHRSVLITELWFAVNGQDDCSRLVRFSRVACDLWRLLRRAEHDGGVGGHARKCDRKREACQRKRRSFPPHDEGQHPFPLGIDGPEHTKYRRIMMVSPRVMLYGYGWIDTAVHEYVHYVVTLRPLLPGEQP